MSRMLRSATYVAKRRRDILVEAGRIPEVFVPQLHAPGAEAEVDFGEAWVILAGVKTKCHMFTFRLSHSGKAIHRVYSTQSQEAFLEGHIDAFDEIGGVPALHIKYDNLTAAVRTVIYGSDRRLGPPRDRRDRCRGGHADREVLRTDRRARAIVAPSTSSAHRMTCSPTLSGTTDALHCTRPKPSMSS